MLDINYIMEELKKERYCFTSEADMQFAFSWKAKELYGECEIIFEQFSVLDIEGKSSYIDLIIRYKGKDYPIEFKYITSSMEYLHFN